MFDSQSSEQSSNDRYKLVTSSGREICDNDRMYLKGANSNTTGDDMFLLRPILFCFLASVVITPLFANDETKIEESVWRNDKLTPEQPFPARVVAVSASWVGYVLLLEEITDRETPTTCMATIGSQQITYSLHLSRNRCVQQMEHPKMHTVFLDRPIAVTKFSWDKGVHKLGLAHGKEDALRGWYVALKKLQLAEVRERKRSRVVGEEETVDD